MDIGDISRVIGFMVPPSLSVWTQRFGRAGRSGEPAIAILLVEPSVYQLRRKSQANKIEEDQDEDDEDEDDGEGGYSDTGQV
jgi:superfamily II DNA helicase RecQ